MIVVALVFPIIATLPVLPVTPVFASILIHPIISTFAIPVVPSMFWAIVGVFTAVVDIVPSEHASWILSDLLSDGRMVTQEVSYFVVLIEIVAVVN